MIRKLLSFAALLSLAALALGFTGRWHPLGDSLAVFRLPNILVSAALIFALPKRRLILAGLFFILLSAASMGIYYWPQKTEAENSLRLYQKNVRYDGTNRAAIRADILQTNPDFITLQEVHIGESYAENLALLSQLNTTHPYSCLLYTSPSPRDATLSRMPSSA